MSGVWLYVVLSLLVSASVLDAKPTEEEATHKDLLMPDVQPQTPDKYLCQPFKMPTEATYITGFIPHANMSTAHHMLLYGCKEPGSNQTWDCGEMGENENEGEGPSYKQGPVCASGASIIYAWAMDAPKLSLPDGIGFKIGGDTGIDYLVLQVHYKVPPPSGNDDSGITIKTTNKKQPKRAGVYLLGTGGSLAPHSVVYMETACHMEEPIVLHPFAFRTHAHTHGEVNSGYRIRDGKWTEIGRETPRKPQMFYDVKDPKLDIQKGDILAARCTMINNGSENVYVGATNTDEMCNFYVMYWVNGDKILENSDCFTGGPPSWSWGDFSGIHLENVPNDASLVPGADEPLAQTVDKLVSSADDMAATLEQEFTDWLEAEEPRVMDNNWIDSMPYNYEEPNRQMMYPDDSEEEYYNELERSLRSNPEDTYDLLRQIQEFYENQ